MISVYKFESWHLDEMTDIISEFENIEQHKSYVKSYGVENVDRHTVTIAWNKKPIAVIGGTFIYPKVMSVFSLLTKEIRKIPIAFTKEVKRIISVYFQTCQLNRMQMEVRANHSRAYFWAQALGFEPEARMKNYGLTNEDYILFARYK